MNRIENKETRQYVGNLSQEEAESRGYSYEQWMEAYESLW